jgi:hypothetical protein
MTEPDRNSTCVRSVGGCTAVRRRGPQDCGCHVHAELPDRAPGAAAPRHLREHGSWSRRPGPRCGVGGGGAAHDDRARRVLHDLIGESVRLTRPARPQDHEVVGLRGADDRLCDVRVLESGRHRWRRGHGKNGSADRVLLGGKCTPPDRAEVTWHLVDQDAVVGGPDGEDLDVHVMVGGVSQCPDERGHRGTSAVHGDQAAPTLLSGRTIPTRHGRHPGDRPALRRDGPDGPDGRG